MEKVGRTYLYPILVNKTIFRDLPHEIIEKIEQEIILNIILKQYKSFKKKKKTFKRLTTLIVSETDYYYECENETEPDNIKTYEWLKNASKYLNKYDLKEPIFKERIEMYILTFELYNREHRYSHNSNEYYRLISYLSFYYLSKLLNKLYKFDIPIRIEDPKYYLNKHIKKYKLSESHDMINNILCEIREQKNKLIEKYNYLPKRYNNFFFQRSDIISFNSHWPLHFH